MTINAQGGEISFALQPGKYGRKGITLFDAADLSYYKTRASAASIGFVQDQQIFPQEVGGLPVPTGSFKQQYFFGGDITMIPRLKEIFGILLLGALGAAATTTGVDSLGNSVSGLNTHAFGFKSGEPAYQPWLSVRRMVPGRISAQNSGEIGVDCKVQMLRFGIPARGKLQCNVGVMGRDALFDDAESWAYANAAYENDLSTPDSGSGTFKIGGVEYPIVGATIEIVNGLTRPQDEAIVGDYRPDDFIALSRGVQIRLVYKYENDDLCRQIYTNGPDNVDWSAIPFYTETAGTVKAFEAYFQSPSDVPGSTVPYGIRFMADRVAWAMDGPPQLAGGAMLTASFVGTVLEPTSGSYIQIKLENAATGASYAITPANVIAFASGLAYTTGNMVLDATAALTSAGISSWDGGKLAVAWSTPTAGSLTANDSFSILTGATITTSGTTLLHTAVEIGTFRGGTYNQPLVIQFNAAATNAQVQDVLKALRYGRTTNSDSTTVFVARITLEDASGNIATDNVTITHS